MNIWILHWSLRLVLQQAEWWQSSSQLFQLIYSCLRKQLHFRPLVFQISFIFVSIWALFYSIWTCHRSQVDSLTRNNCHPKRELYTDEFKKYWNNDSCVWSEWNGYFMNSGPTALRLRKAACISHELMVHPNGHCSHSQLISLITFPAFPSFSLFFPPVPSYNRKLLFLTQLG